MRHPRIAIGFQYLREQWKKSIIFFFVVFAFFVGIAFILAPFAPDEVNYGVYRVWGDSGLVVFGIVYIALSVWAVFWPESPGGFLTTSTLSLIGLATSLPPLGMYWNITGTIFYGLILSTLFIPLAREKFVRRRGS
jgi:hypothetical protein